MCVRVGNSYSSPCLSIPYNLMPVVISNTEEESEFIS